MKVKELLDEAENDISTERDTAIINLIKGSLKNIASCKKTLRKCEKTHEELLNTDTDDIELDDYAY